MCLRLKKLHVDAPNLSFLNILKDIALEDLSLQCPKLEILSASSCKAISYDVLPYILPTSLKELVFYEFTTPNLLEDSSIQKILSLCPKLSTFCIFGNKNLKAPIFLSDQLLILALVDCPQLETIGIDCPNLKILSLKNPKLSSMYKTAFIEILKNCKSLKEVYLHGDFKTFVTENVLKECGLSFDVFKFGEEFKFPY